MRYTKPQKKKDPRHGKLGKRSSHALYLQIDQSIGRSVVYLQEQQDFGVVVIDDWGFDRPT
jgi:hypothetical protein